MQAVGRPLLSDRAHSRATRAMIAESLVGARLLSGCGAWWGLQPTDERRLGGVRAKAARRMVKLPRPEGVATDEEALQLAGFVPLAVVMRCRRLGYFCRFVRSAPRALLALAQQPGDEWRRQLVADLAWLRAELPDKLQALPHPAARPQVWEDLCRANPHEWKLLLALVGTRRRRRLDEARDQLWSVIAARRAEAAAAPPPIPSAEVGAWRCASCPRTFTSENARRMHDTRVHGRTCWTRRVPWGTECEACGWQFWSRLRLRLHLLRSSCGQAARAALEDQTAEDEEAAAAADVAERAEAAQARRTGRAVDEAAVPARPPADAAPAEVEQEAPAEERQERASASA